MAQQSSTTDILILLMILMLHSQCSYSLNVSTITTETLTPTADSFSANRTLPILSTVSTSENSSTVGTDGFIVGGNRTQLYLAGLFPLSVSGWIGDYGLQSLSAVQIAIEDINKREDVLPEYELVLVYRDTQVCRSCFYFNF